MEDSSGTDAGHIWQADENQTVDREAEVKETRGVCVRMTMCFIKSSREHRGSGADWYSTEFFYSTTSDSITGHVDCTLHMKKKDRSTHKMT